jgi:type II secretory pathway pseudopilin PulG
VKQQQAGFSLVEIAVVIGLSLICLGVGIIPLRSTIATLDADKASGLVLSQLAYARQIAVDQRRNVLVQFVGTNRITVTRQESDASTTVLSDVTLPSGYVFGKPTGVTSTPDSVAVTEMNGGTSGTFLGDGTALDNLGILLNGCVYTIGSGNGSARAVTLSGSSGKVKRFWLQGTNWVVE